MDRAGRSAVALEEIRAEEAELASLIGRAAEADQNALAALYDRTSPRVYGLVLRILRDQEAAEEITLDVYMQVYRQASSYDAARGNPMAWLLTLARSRAIDRLRSESRRRRRETPLETGLDVASLAPDPGESSAASELTHLMRAALENLSPEQRQVLHIAYYSGLTQSEIAAELRLPLGTVKTRMRSGMIMLRAQLRPFLAEERT